LKYFYCSLFEHEFVVTKNVTFHVKEYECIHCKKQVTTNGDGGLILLTHEHKEINYALEEIHIKKVKKKSAYS